MTKDINKLFDNIVDVAKEIAGGETEYGYYGNPKAFSSLHTFYTELNKLVNPTCEWKKAPDFLEYTDTIPSNYTSQCGKSYSILSKYCPNCGGKITVK